MPKIIDSVEDFAKDRGFQLNSDFSKPMPKYFSRGDLEKCWEAATDKAFSTFEKTEKALRDKIAYLEDKLKKEESNGKA